MVVQLVTCGFKMNTDRKIILKNDFSGESVTITGKDKKKILWSSIHLSFLGVNK